MSDLATLPPMSVQNSQLMPVDPMIRMIEAVVQNPDLPLERLEKLMDMKNKQEDRQREDQARADRKSYFAAMADCQAEMPLVFKNKKNDHTKSRYEDLGAVLAAAQPIIARHGFSVSFHPGGVENSSLLMNWTVSHADGHQEKGQAGYPIDATGTGGKVNKTGVQALASTETYARRYLMKSLFNIASSDDNDGNVKAVEKATITAEQFIELQGLIELAGISEDVLCKAAKIETLHELPADTFESAAKKLRTTIENKAKLLEEA